MKSYFGTYRTALTAASEECTVLVFDKNLNIGIKNPEGGNRMINWQLKDVDASFDPPSAQSRITCQKEKGSLLIIEGNDVAQFIKGRQAERLKPWYKKSSGVEWMRNGFLLLLILGVLFFLYLLIVPWLSQAMASKVSIKTEKQLGDAVYSALQLSEREDSSKSVILNRFFRAMEIETAYEINISVVNDHTVNAFALPGGRIVVYSGLLKEINSYPELAALLGHEFMHINNKHSTKSIFRRLGSKIFLSLLFGRFGAVTSVVVDQADNLRSMKYSRSLEKEADTEGLSILMKRNIDPRGFENLFNHLKSAGPTQSLPEMLSSHPDISKRIEYIKEQATGARVVEDSTLKAIFEQINLN